MRIPHTQLSAVALRAVVEEFVTRDGTDDSSGERRIETVLCQLDAGRVELHFDGETQTCHIVPVEEHSLAGDGDAGGIEQPTGRGTKRMSRKGNKAKKRTVPADRGRVLVLGGEPKMSEVILDLADPLLDGDVSNAKKVDSIVQLTIAAWNKAMFPADRQAAMERDIIDTLVPSDGNAEQVNTIIQALDIVEERRKKLFPHLRRFVVDYELRVAEGRVALNVLSESMSGEQTTGRAP